MKHVDWAELGIDRVQTAGSAQEGLSICKYFQPDIVLSDIRMRGMTGIEMCAEIHRSLPDCQIIFISGYSNKEYYKAAIKIGAVNYIEKPVNLEELREAVRNAVCLLRAGRERKAQDKAFMESVAYIKEKVFYSIINGGLGEDGYDSLGACGMFEDAYPLFRACVLRTSAPVTDMLSFIEKELMAIPRTLPEAGFHLEYQLDSNRRVILLLNGTGEALCGTGPLAAAMKAMALSPREGPELFLAMGKPAQGILGAAESYIHACEIEKSVFYRGYPCAAESAGQNGQADLPDNIFEDFVRALDAWDESGAKAVISGLSQTVKHARMLPGTKLRTLILRLDHKISQERDKCTSTGIGIGIRIGIHKHASSKDGEKEYSQLLEMDTIDAVCGYLTGSIESLFAEKRRNELNNSTVTQVLRIIEEEFGRMDISVRYLAEKVYLTPTYLSGLFKRTTGKTIGETITDTRIEQSKTLLRDKKLKLYHIANMVGFEDPNYFAKIFKKKTRLTPSEYRERV